MCGLSPMNETCTVFEVLRFARKSGLRSGHEPLWDVSGEDQIAHYNLIC